MSGQKLPAGQLKKLTTQIEAWQKELVNLTRRNKLLYFRHNPATSLEIEAPSIRHVWQRLESPGWSFFEPPEAEDDDGEDDPTSHAPAADELVTQKRSPSDLGRALRGLERATNQAQLDTGLHILYMAFGMLRWSDPADSKTVESPIFLQPVVFLERASLQAPFRVRLGEEDPIINPALAIKLSQDFSIELPSIDETGEDPLAALEAIRQSTRGQKGWTVEPRVVMTTFTFHKEAMYRDLVENADVAMATPLVQAIGLGPQAEAVADLHFDPPSDETLDEIAPAEKLVSIRDADSTQRACIVAASAGRSFVMDGPPGTGKSQTITNIIAELLHAGRSVLFVSEKAAALDVVHKRLEQAGLAEFVLELHSHKATRKEFAATLGRALTSRPRAAQDMPLSDEAALARIRKELNAYAVALNEIRRPLGRSLHDVIGRVTQLQHLPHAPVAGLHGQELTPEAFEQIAEAADQLGRTWAPVELGDQFLWRDLRDTQTGAARAQAIETTLLEARKAAEILGRTIDELIHDTGLLHARDLDGAETLYRQLIAVESHDGRAQFPTAWLTTENSSEIRSLAEQYCRLVREQAEATDASNEINAEWRTLDTTLQDRLGEPLRSLAEMSPVVIPPPTATAGWSSSLSTIASRLAAVSNSILSETARIATFTGLPSDHLTVARAGELSELGLLVQATDRPERSWLNPVVQTALTEAETVLRTLVEQYRAQRDQLVPVFRESVLELDLVGLRARFEANTGLKKLGGKYRADKKALAPHVTTDKVTGEIIEKLAPAIEWKSLADQLSDAERRHGPSLGSYYADRSTVDFPQIERALDLTRQALALAGGAAPEPLANQLARDASPDPELYATAVRVRSAISDWESCMAELTPYGIDVDQHTELGSIAAWALQASHMLTDVEGALTDCSPVGTITLQSAQSLLNSVELYRAAAASTASLNDQANSTLGHTFAEVDTDFERLLEELDWAERVREVLGGRCHERVATALLELPPVADKLRRAIDDVDKAWATIAELFEASWRARLNEEFVVSLDDGIALLDELADATGQIDVWVRHHAAQTTLVESGLAPAVEFLETQQAVASSVAPVIERSLLESWIDDVMAGDHRLRTTAADDRTTLVKRFQDLDRKQIALASAKVIEACNARRPSSTVGVAGLIRRESEKKTRHMPIRKLLSETQEVALALKPCFMMSPLTVSQFLPADLRFDVVIFDEASQVKPSEAVNCIYRGRQLIVAGDPKQLPPTSFFDTMAGGSEEYDEEAPEDFESVLDACRSSGLATLSLRWHYRSQHESLITYSNYGFYDGKLHTFPGALQHAEDVGVELFKVDGVYRRGAGQDNQIEADTVVDRVLFHRRTHPNLTLGVVAFSSAQESTIAATIERRAREDPELNELLTTDRLDGFFVKNLENVQGDERDIIIFSIGYGPDENGKFTENLGPLNKQGGERRLNVAITRARRRNEIIASITAADFPGTSKAPGVRHLQRYLEFAQRGIAALALDIDPEQGGPESPFEVEVLRTISGWGISPTPQVGVAGFRIDIGIRHPDRPGEFALGIECDGAAYHSSRVARDRDRLRQEVLENLGWRLYRIWGPAWYRDRAGQERALHAAIADALDGKPRRRASEATWQNTQPAIQIEEVVLDDTPTWAIQYQVSGAIDRARLLQLEISTARTNEIVDLIVTIIDDEAPIHEEVLRRRVSEALQIGRMGKIIRAAYDDALRKAKRASASKLVNGYFVIEGRDPVVRAPDPDDERTRRTIAEIDPTERRAAIAQLVGDARRVEQADLGVAFSRLFGWRRAGVDIQTAFELDLAQLLRQKRLRRDGGRIILG